MQERRLTVADQGWSWVVLASSFCANTVVGGFYYAIGVIHNALLERFNEDVEKTAWASSLFLGMTALTGVLASALINRYSCRVTMIIGAVLMSIGFFICALVPSHELVTIFFGGLGGIGAGLTYLTAVVVIGFNFNRKRNIASGIAVSGTGVGTFVLAPVVEAAREEYGSRGFFYIIAGIALHQALFGSLFFPSELESEQIQTRHQDSVSRNKYAILNTILHSFMILKHTSLLCLCGSMFFASTGICLVYVHFPRYSIEMGLSPLNASFLMSVSGVCNCMSRVLAGMVSNDGSIDENVMLFGPFGLLGLSTLLFPLYVFTYEGQLAYAVFLGLYSGCFFSIMNTLIIQLVGIEELATGSGICMFFFGIGALIGPPVAGAIIDYGGSYEHSFLLAGLLFCRMLYMTVAAFLGMAVAYYKRTENPFTTNDPEIPTVSKTVTTE